MSGILGAIKEAQHDSNNLDELAKLPQTLIMSMAQRGEIKPDMVMPILGRKAEMADEAAKMNAAKQLAAQGGVQPTVMDQYMGKIAQAENPAPVQQMPMPQAPEDVGIASQATAPMQLAGGGIIAFEGGGDVDDEEDRYDRYKKKAQRNADFAGIDAMRREFANMPVSGSGITAGHHGAEQGMTSSGDLESRLRAAIMQKESGGKRYDKAGNLLTSHKGAQGEMQVMPGTAKDPGFGIKAARDNSPDELRRVGDEYSNMLLNRYRDPKLAMIAYNMGPGATDKWLANGADISKLPKETQGYIRNVNLAQGGEVKHYAAGDYVDDTQYDPISGLPTYGFDTYSERSTEREAPSNFFMDQPWQRKTAKETNKKIATTKPSRGKASPTEVEQFFSRYDNVPVNGVASQLPQNFTNVKQIQENADNQNFDLMQYIRAREAKMDEAAKMDKWQAALAAGLGMLGGTSQYAWENIGKGGQMGVQQLAQSQKLRAAQDKAHGELYGDAARMDLANKQREDVLREKKREFNEKQGLASSEKLNAAIAAARKAPQNATNMLMLNALESQFANGKLDQSKLAELERLRKWNQNLENSVRQNFAGTSEGSGMRLVGVRG